MFAAGFNARRNPVSNTGTAASTGLHAVTVQSSGEQCQEPPRMAQRSPLYAAEKSRMNQSRQSSCTFPCMSYSPQALGDFRPFADTDGAERKELPRYQAISPRAAEMLSRARSSRPLLSSAVVPARHAYSHSASFGSVNR